MQHNNKLLSVGDLGELLASLRIRHTLINCQYHLPDHGNTPTDHFVLRLLRLLPFAPGERALIFIKGNIRHCFGRFEGS